ncbi:hypothetical protein ACJQWK_02276 [Exserohilum turcicum]|uniref:Uncharacterized protein n=1 Tax=Exserohilum turcicum (strain 28A) TaxID=671987 RepID=R0ISY5_EXST2|nr:uncharacterized protein SETTUDRAFT_28053 [Exserohilum turcica Et28A]EOA87751.1 hypothetical protein SETTUDRAFT_28053 [Exserohilum turcica Et28A]
MRFSTILPALFAAATSAAKFQNYIDNSCQSYAGDFNFVSAKEQQQLTLQQFASVPEWSNKDRDLQCPHNKQNTYRYILVPQWNSTGVESPRPTVQGGGFTVIYHDDTDTYALCYYLASPTKDSWGSFGKCTKDV